MKDPMDASREQAVDKQIEDAESNEQRRLEAAGRAAFQNYHSKADGRWFIAKEWQKRIWINVARAAIEAYNATK